MTQQITTLKSQLQTAENQYSALTGSSGLGSLVSGSTGLLKGNLPQDWTQVYQDAMNSSSSITPSASSMLGQFKSQIDGMGRGDALKFVQQQLQMKGAYDRQMAQTAYDNQMRELNDIQALTDQINQTTTPKQIMDLQARIQIAQGAIQGEQAKLQLMGMAQQAQDKLLKAQQDEALTRYTIGTNQDDNTAPRLTN
ncbi:MAG: type IV secretion system protein [Burkholderia sp.]